MVKRSGAVEQPVLLNEKKREHDEGQTMRMPIQSINARGWWVYRRGTSTDFVNVQLAIPNII